MPVPSAKTPVRLAIAPDAMTVGLAAKLVIVVPVTVTVAVWLIAVPLVGVTVRVYAVVTVGLTLTAFPLVTAIPPGVTTPVPPAKTAVRLVLAPPGIVARVGAKLEIVGGGITFTVVVCVTGVPAELVTVRV
jgi:hypothetical protein